MAARVLAKPSRAIVLIASAALLALLAALLAAPAPAFAEVRKSDSIVGRTVEERDLTVASCPSVEADKAVLMSSDGTVYFARNSEEPSRIASLTKVMTAMVAIDQAPDDLRVVVSASAIALGDPEGGFEEGDVMDLETAITALLVPTGNEAAVALAESVGAAMISADPALGTDAVSVFVDAMNAKAAEIGCTDTLYENPHGLDDGIYDGQLHSTALDQAQVARNAMAYPLIHDAASTGSTAITVTRKGVKTSIDLETTDLLLGMYTAAVGMKAGFTDSSGPSFMGAAREEDRELYVVVLDAPDSDARFQDAKNLFVWAFAHAHDLPLANSAERATMELDGARAEVPIVAEAPHADWIDRTVPATLADPDAYIQVFDFEGNISQSLTFDELHGTVHEGDKVGSIVYKQRNQVVAEMDLVACETVAAPNPLETLGISWQRLTGALGDAPSQAQPRVYNVMPVIDNNKTNAA